MNFSQKLSVNGFPVVWNGKRLDGELSILQVQENVLLYFLSTADGAEFHMTFGIDSSFSSSISQRLIEVFEKKYLEEMMAYAHARRMH